MRDADSTRVMEPRRPLFSIDPRLVPEPAVMLAGEASRRQNMRARQHQAKDVLLLGGILRPALPLGCLTGRGPVAHHLVREFLLQWVERDREAGRAAVEAREQVRQ